MCFTRTDRPASSEMLKHMCDTIVHRGPDDEGTYVEGPVGLGMRRLSIIDLQSGSQPIFNEDGTISVVMNGEIYNFQSIRDDLVKKGHKFATGSDTEVLVYLYEEYGPDLVEHLNGMFAFALWDQSRRRLVIARDRLGQKPLYYAWTRDGLVFGSELKCLQVFPELMQDLDHTAIYHYFVLGYIPQPHSVYANIRQLPPASRIVVENGKMAIDRYWSLPTQVDFTVPASERQDQLRLLLADAVRLRMISDVPFGAFLSGGIDSSVTVALMAQQSSSPVKTFYIDFDEPEFSEREFARSVAQRYGTDHHELTARPSAIDLIDDLVCAFDEPFGDSSSVPTYLVSKLTRQHVTVALAGDGGDEAFGGYRRYQDILQRRTRSAAFRKIAGPAGRSLQRALPRTAPGRRYFRSLGMTNDEWFVVGTNELEARDILAEDFLDGISPSATYDLLSPCLDAADRRDALAPYTYLDTHYYLPGDILTKVDRMSMAHSLEVRSPFMDYRLAEFAARLPVDMKIHNGVTKKILKDVFAKDLPDEVLRPRKRGFSIPLEKWFRGELKSMLSDVLHDSELAETGIFRMNEVQGWANEHWSGARNRKSQLWRFLFFARWWRHHKALTPLAAAT